jgi:hypothetical protein
LHELFPRLGRRSDALGKAGVARDGLIVERSADSAIGKCQQQENAYASDRYASAAADALRFLGLGMEIQSAGRFNWLVIGAIGCVHG